MARKMKKMLALLLALTLVVGQLAVPAMATEANENLLPPAPGGGDPTPAPADLQMDTVPIDNGTQTTSTYTDPGTGAAVTVIITETETTDPDTGVTTENISTETTSVTGTPTDTNVKNEWEHITTETGSDVQEGNPKVETDTEVVTTVEGSEEADQTIKATGVGTVVKGELHGEETTNIDGTTVITTTTEGVVTGHEIKVDTDYQEETPETDTTDNPYVPVPGTETNNGWVDGKIKEGKVTGTETDTSSKTLRPDHEGDVKLNLKPNEQWVTKTVEISEKDLDINNLPAGATITEKRDKDGNLTAYIVTYKEKSETTKDPVQPDPNLGTWVPTGVETETYVNPGGYTVGSNTTGDDLDAVENGESVNVTIEEIYVNGKYEGYRIITTTTTKATSDTTDEAVGTRTDAEYEKVEGDTQPAGYTMPEKPEESTVTARTGETTTVKVDLIEENGEPRGYTVTTEIRDREGKLLRRETRNIYGTTHTSQTTVETDPTAERTTSTTLVTKTEVQEIRTIESTREMKKVDTHVNNYTTTIVNETDTYQMVNVGEDMYFLYQGRMYKVEAMSKHGDASVKTLKPANKYITATSGSDLRNKNGTSNGLFGEYSDKKADSFSGDYDFRYVGNGAASTLRVNYNDGSTTTNHQFALRDKAGNLLYVYCCDLDTSAVAGTYYEIENLKDAGYYSTAEGSDVIDHIRAIATNGFWATSGGKNDAGTLDAVKQLLKDYDKYFPENLTAVANSLTEGQALTATQAALWAFGNKGSTPDEDDLVGYYKTNWYTSDAIDERNVSALYKLLISDRLKNVTEDTATDMIDEKDISGSSITIHGEATNADGSTKTSGGKTVYDTDVSFTLKVDKSSLTGNLKVTVYQNDKPVSDTIQIATDHSNFLGKAVADNKNGTTTITIANVELAEGVEFSIRLDGTQKLEEGVYLYTAQGGNSASQTFVGVTEGTREVHLKADLEFKVSDPKVKKVNKEVTTTRVDTQNGTRTNYRTEKKVNTKTTDSGNTKTNVTHEIDIISTVTETETKKDITKEDRKWEAYWEYLLTTIEGEDDDDDDRRRRRTEILDEEVPLADAPRTGDISGLWAAVSAVSLAGAAMLSIKRKEEEA